MDSKALNLQQRNPLPATLIKKKPGCGDRHQNAPVVQGPSELLGQNEDCISNEEQMGSSNDQFDKLNNEIYDGLKLFASRESLSSDGDSIPNI